MRSPIERRRQVVNEPPKGERDTLACELEEAGDEALLVRVLLANRASERLSLFEIGSFRFEPEEVGNVRESESSFQSRLWFPYDC